MKIAQRFIAGLGNAIGHSPRSGRLKISPSPTQPSASRTRDVNAAVHPALKRWAIFNRPLRGREGTQVTGHKTFCAKRVRLCAKTRRMRDSIREVIAMEEIFRPSATSDFIMGPGFYQHWVPPGTDGAISTISVIIPRQQFNQEDLKNMRRTYLFALALLAVILIPSAAFSQDTPMEASRSVAGGGVSVPGWTGKIDAKEEAAGMTLNSAKLTKEGGAFHVITGPAVTYWNPANKASGDYTVRATFREPKFMNLNTHPHPYGIVIAGNDLGTDQQSYLYCAAYGDGKFIVRGMGPSPFQMNGRGTPDPAVNKAAAVGQPVEQEIAMSVKGDKVSCSINNKEVWTAAKSDLVTAGKLKSTNGVYGLRTAHNTEIFVTGLKMRKN